MSHALGKAVPLKKMKTNLFRWVTCGAIPVALLALSGCNGLSNGGPPDLVFSASSGAINAGQTVTLNWQSANATSVTITAKAGSATRTVTTSSQTEVTGPLPTSGSFAGIPVASTTTYTLTASGPGGTSAPATVTVTVPFTLNFTASPSTITSGESATLAWQITGGTATSLSISDAAGNAICNPCALP